MKKEIKVKFTGYKQERVNVGFGQQRYVYNEFTIQPVSLVESFDFTKKYKLVEDVPATVTLNIETNKIPKDTLDRLVRAIDIAYKPSQVVTLNHVSPKQPVARVMFNGRATILEIGDFKVVVKCHKEDKFIPRIGLGLALYRYYQRTNKKEIKWLNKNLDYDQIAEYCLLRFYNFDTKKLSVITSPEEATWIEL